MPSSAQAQVLDADHPNHRADGALRGVGEREVDGVYEAAIDVGGGAAQHDQDRDGDEKADDRIAQLAAGQNPNTAATMARR